MNQENTIFLAHANEDKPIIRRLYNELKANGLNPWLDEEDLLPGMKWDDEIVKTIKNSSFFLACLSSHSVLKNGYIQKELKLALSVMEQKPVGANYFIPLLIEDIDIPEIKVGTINMRDYQAVYLYKEGEMVKLIKHLKQDNKIINKVKRKENPSTLKKERDKGTITQDEFFSKNSQITLSTLDLIKTLEVHENELVMRKSVLSGTFVPRNNEYVEIEIQSSDTSINGVTTYLEYKIEQVHIYFGDMNPNNKIQAIGLEIFTENIAFIVAKKSTLEITKSDVDMFMEEFDYDFEYDITNVEDIFAEGIQNQSLSSDYLAKVLNIKKPIDNEIIYVDKFEVNLYFINGLLASYKFAGKLGKWARHFRKINPNFVDKYVRVSKLFWNENLDKIYKEVNVQLESLANLSQGLKNEFIPLHRTPHNTINFYMILICHYGKDSTIDEFMDINYGRFKKLNENDYLVGNFVCKFDNDGKLIQTKQHM